MHFRLNIERLKKVYFYDEYKIDSNGLKYRNDTKIDKDNIFRKIQFYKLAQIVSHSHRFSYDKMTTTTTTLNKIIEWQRQKKNKKNYKLFTGFFI